MSLSIYKPGQGYWTRVLSLIGLGVLVLAGVAWLWQELGAIADDSLRATVQSSASIGVILVVGAFLYWIFNKPRIVDFLIATESEMRKVNWPSRREIIGSTWIVICGTVMFAAMLFLYDLGFAQFFMLIGILQGEG